MLTETNARQSEQLTGLQQRINKLLAQIAWFTRQFYGRKSEKLSLFEVAGANPEELEQIEAARAGAEEQIEPETKAQKKKRSNRDMLEDLPVFEEVIEPEEVDKTRYKLIGEECTRTLEF